MVVPLNSNTDRVQSKELGRGREAGRRILQQERGSQKLEKPKKVHRRKPANTLV